MPRVRREPARSRESGTVVLVMQSVDQALDLVCRNVRELGLKGSATRSRWASPEEKRDQFSRDADLTSHPVSREGRERR
jgi:hypothetical protein